MTKVLNSKNETGSRTSNEPRLFFPDTHLSVDLKLMTHMQGRMPVGAYLNGIITRDGDDHFVFTEKAALEKEGLIEKE